MKTIVRLLTALGLLALSLPAFGEDTTCYKFDDLTRILAGRGFPVYVIPDVKLPGYLDKIEKQTGKRYENVSRAFVTTSGNTVSYGLEVDGCLIPKIDVPVTNPDRRVPEPTEPSHEPGRTGAGTYA